MNLIRPRSNTTQVFRDDVAKKNGLVLSGFQTEHWDGRIDATALCPTPSLILQGSVNELAPGEFEIIQRVNGQHR